MPMLLSEIVSLWKYTSCMYFVVKGGRKEETKSSKQQKTYLLARKKESELLLYSRVVAARVEDLLDRVRPVQLQGTAERLRVLPELLVDLHCGLVEAEALTSH